MTTFNDKNEILERIDELCARRKWTRYVLANRAKMSHSTISNLFIRNSFPSLPILVRLCDGFGISLSEFFLDESKRNSSLNEMEGELITKYRTLSPRGQRLLSRYIDYLLSEQEKKTAQE